MMGSLMENYARSRILPDQVNFYQMYAAISIDLLTDVIPRYVRVNTLKTSVEEIIDVFEKNGWTHKTADESYPAFIEAVKGLEDKVFLSDINIPELLVFPAKTEMHQYEEYRNGKLILQDKVN